jgi:hypothetical protein
MPFDERHEVFLAVELFKLEKIGIGIAEQGGDIQGTAPPTPMTKNSVLTHEKSSSTGYIPVRKKKEGPLSDPSSDTLGAEYQLRDPASRPANQTGLTSI